MRYSVLLFAVLVTSQALAQPLTYDVTYRPATAQFNVLTTSNFDVIYEVGYEAEAAELGAQLERYLQPAAELVGHRGYLRMPVILRGYDDTANGFVSVRPFRQEIDAVGIKGPVLTSRHESWIEAVAPHELVHALHADARPGGGLGSIVRPFAPDHARSINLGGPSGINEGIAVLFESSIREGAGRLNHPHFVMKYRAAMAGNHWSLAQMLERTTFTQPFDRHYVGGGLYMAFLAERGDLEAFQRARRTFYRFPFLGYGVSMWWGNGEAPFQTGAAIRDHWWTIEQERLQAEGPFDAPQRLLSEPGLTIQSPQWLNDDELVVHARGYDLRPGFYRVDAASGERSLIAHHSLSGEGTFDLDRASGLITFSRYQSDVLPTDAARAGVFQLDVDTRRTAAVAPRSRIHSPVLLPDGSLLGLRNDGQYSSIVRLDDTAEVEQAYDGTMLLRQIAPRPGTDEVAILANVAGNEGVLRGRAGDLNETLAPWLFLDGMPIYDIAWSADGEYLIFAAAPGDVSNIYAMDAASGRIAQLTHARFGALHGSLSPDNERLAYVHYEHERYELAVAPARFDREVEVARIDPAWPPVRDSFEIAEADVRPYRAARYLAPRLVSPLVIVDEDVVDDELSLGPGFGLAVEGVDPLLRWAYGGNAYYRKQSVWGSAGVSYGGSPLRPTLRVFRDPSTAVARFSETETRRIGRERRGVGLSMSLPLTLAANVYTTRVTFGLAGSFEQERFFDDDDGNTLRVVGEEQSYRDLMSLRPSIYLMYRLQANTRDLAPNTGVILSSGSRYDVWDEFDRPARALINRLYTYLPLMTPTNGSVRLDAGLLVQNARGGLETALFLPRGFRDRFLGEGTFARAGIELIQPLRFVDDGSILVPFYLQALYGFAAAEGLSTIDGPDHRLGSATAGLGVRARVFHLTDLDIRVGITIRNDARIRASWR